MCLVCDQGVCEVSFLHALTRSCRFCGSVGVKRSPYDLIIFKSKVGFFEQCFDRIYNLFFIQLILSARQCPDHFRQHNIGD